MTTCIRCSVIGVPQDSAAFNSRPGRGTLCSDCCKHYCVQCGSEIVPEPNRNVCSICAAYNYGAQTWVSSCSLPPDGEEWGEAEYAAYKRGCDETAAEANRVAS